MAQEVQGRWGGCERQLALWDGDNVDVDVSTSELVEKISNFRDEDRHVSLKKRSIYSEFGVTAVHRIIHEDMKMLKICAKFVPGIAQ